MREYKPTDLTGIVGILNYYVKNDTCIFQMEPYTLEEIKDKFNINLAE